MKTRSMLICFEPQQKNFLMFIRLSKADSIWEKVELLAEQGISQVLCLKFNEEIRKMSRFDLLASL